MQSHCFSRFLAKAESQVGKLYRFSLPWVPMCALFTTQMYFATGMFVFVFLLGVSPLMYFLHLSVTTGTENGSSSQGTAGQSGLIAGSTGGVSKAAKGQGSAEKEDQTGNQKRARRQWESWSAEDKNSFFEGLYEVRLFLLKDQNILPQICSDSPSSFLSLSPACGSAALVCSTGKTLKQSRTTLP